jgi:hypothetical protein
MHQLPTNFSNGTLNVEGVPDAVRLIALSSPQAKRLADLTLHRKDLEFAETCLLELASTHGKSDYNDFVKEALWRAAIVHLFKCYGNSVRFQLSPNAVFKGEPPEAMIVFEHFKSLRNKHLVHDENSYLQCQPAAAINDGTKSYKIEKVVCVSIAKDTLQQESFNNLHLLVTHTKKWVIAEIDQLADSITKQLESEPYADLAKKPSLTVTSASVADVGVKRGSPKS